MAIEIRNPYEVKLVFEVDGDEITLDPSVHFTAHCDQCDKVTEEWCPLTHTPAQLAQIEEFAKSVWYPQIKQRAGVP